MKNDAKIVFFGLEYVRRRKKVKDERNIGKLGSEKRSLNDEVGPQRGDKDAPKAQVREIALTPGDCWSSVGGTAAGQRRGGGGKLPVRP